MIVLSGCWLAGCAQPTADVSDQSRAELRESSGVDVDEVATRGVTSLGRFDRVVRRSGLVIEDVTVGSGDICMPDSLVTVNYRAWTRHAGPDEGVFDSTDGRGPATFDLTELVEGWRQGLPGMREGGVRRLTVPPSLGYGAAAQVDETGEVIIPAGSTLVFEIELVGVR